MTEPRCRFFWTGTDGTEYRCTLGSHRDAGHEDRSKEATQKWLLPNR